MSARRLLLIDPDENFFRVLHEQVTPYGFEIYRVAETPDALSHVRELAPEMVFIAVEEPDKLGYSLCNKAKKGVARDIPVILTTSSVPPSGFHSHRKLRVHADEYIDKRTMSAEELIGKIDGLIGLGGDLVEEVGYEEVEMEEFDISMDAFADEADKTRIAAPGMMAGMEYDPAVEAAAADLVGGFEGNNPFLDEDDLEADSAPEYYSSDVVTSDSEETVDAPSGLAAPPPAVSTRQPSRIQPAPPPAARRSGPIPTARRPGAVPAPIRERRSGPNAAAGGGLDLGLDRVAEMATEERSGSHDLRAQFQNLERENQRLKAELEKAKQSQGAAGGAKSSFSREREFLNLREIINRKEKEILELRDEVGDKERAILDGKQQIRQLQRAKAELDSSNLELEQRLLGSSEALDALQAERDSALERVQAYEDRVQQLEADLTESDMTAELDGLKKELEQLGTEKTQAVAELEEKLEALRKQHDEAIEQLKTAHAEALEEARETATGSAKEDHLKAIAERDEKAQRELAEQRSKYEEELKALGDKNAEELERLKREHKEALAGHQGQSASNLDELKRTHADAVAALETEKDQLQQGLTSAREQLEEFKRSLNEAEKTIAAREATIAEHLATIAERDERIGALKTDVDDLEGQNTGFQEQVLKAYHKIKSDEATVAKAKKALAIALTLLDENIATIEPNLVAGRPED